MEVSSDDYKQAACWFKRASDQGDRRSTSNLGDLYATGNGVDKDYEEAVRLYRIAADQGDHIAATRMGDMYANGTGVPVNYAQAVAWYDKAAEVEKTRLNCAGLGKEDISFSRPYHTGLKNLLAKLVNSGRLLLEGQEVLQDYREAARLFRLAADRGHAGAQAKLGYMYFMGFGVLQDLDEAAHWYQKAAAQDQKAAAQGAAGPETQS